MPILETRPTSPVKLAKAIAVGVAVAVPLLMFVAPLLTRVNMTGVSVGQPVEHPVFGHGVVDTVNPMERTAFVEFERTRVVLPLDQLH